MRAHTHTIARVNVIYHLCVWFFLRVCVYMCVCPGKTGIGFRPSVPENLSHNSPAPDSVGIFTFFSSCCCSSFFRQLGFRSHIYTIICCAKKTFRLFIHLHSVYIGTQYNTRLTWILYLLSILYTCPSHMCHMIYPYTRTLSMY